MGFSPEQDPLLVCVTGEGVERFVDFHLHVENLINPSAWGHLNPSSYCDVGRLFTGYLNYGLNCREKK